MSQHHVLRAFESRAVSFFIAARFRVVVVARFIQTLDLFSLFFPDPVVGTFICVACGDRVATQIPVIIVALPIFRALDVIAIRLVYEASRTSVSRTMPFWSAALVFIGLCAIPVIA
jgi:hypothetical protein